MTSDGATATFEAAPGEEQLLNVHYEQDPDRGAEVWFTDLQNRIDTTTPDQCSRAPGFESDDTIICRGTPRVVVNAGDRNDRVTGTDGADQVNGGDGNDYLQGGAGNDTVDGGPGDDDLEGSASVTVVNRDLRLGSDTLFGGPGNDTVSYQGSTTPITATLDGAPGDGEAGENDHIQGDVEGVRGGYGNDTLTGNDAPNGLFGDSGDDELRAGGGDDRVHGGRDQDRSYGGDGDDEIFSGHGDDFLNGGPGLDRMDSDGGDGVCGYVDCADRTADTIDARDGVRDVVGCGINVDRVQADGVDDVAADCENVERGGGGTGPALTVSVSKKLKLRKALRSGLPITVGCDQACSVSASATAKGAGTVGKGRTRLSEVGRRKLVVKFTAKAKKRLASKRSVKLSVRLKAAGDAKSVRRTITLTR